MTDLEMENGQSKENTRPRAVTFSTAVTEKEEEIHSPKTHHKHQMSVKKIVRKISVIPYAGKGSAMAAIDCIEKPLSIFFYKYSRYFLAKHPWPFIIVPIITTLVLIIGIFFATVVDDAVYLYTPTNARSKYERRVIEEKWPLLTDNYVPGRAVTLDRQVQLIVMAKDNANILLPQYAEAVRRLQEFVREEVVVEYKRRKFYYRDLCLTWKSTGCVDNLQVQAVSNAFNKGQKIFFPTLDYFGKTAYLAGSMGGVGQEEVTFRDELIDWTVFHSQTLTEELKRNAAPLFSRFALAFVLLAAFSVICLMTVIGRRPYIDWTVSKPTLALLGLINAFMGVISSLGLLNAIGVPYNDIVLVMPFLVVAIGIDNMFLMVSALRRTSRSLPVEKRVAECLSDAAISITITALTDALSFGVGAITSIPAVQIFCVYTSVAIIITFFYQLSFFTGLLLIQATLEEKGKHCLLFINSRTMAPRAQDDEDDGDQQQRPSLFSRLFLSGSAAPTVSSETPSDLSVPLMSTVIEDWYAPFLMQPVVRGLVMLALVVYLLVAAWGCLQLREGLEPINLLVADSYAIPHYKRLEQFFWDYGAQVQVVFNDLPNDLSNSSERDNIKRAIGELANTRHTVGSDGVVFWLDALEKYVRETLPGVADMERNFYGIAKNFFGQNTFEMWEEDVVWDVNRTRIVAFRCLIGLKDFSKTTQQRTAMSLLREAATRQGAYNVTTFMPIWLFADQYALILPNTLQNIGIGLVCMLVIALLLIPQPVCALWVAFAIASIDVGVVGYMTLWNVNLDAISMITIIMSIGFAVDFSAHVTYGYVISDEELPADRVKTALGALGWPIAQGALSTILGVSVLSTVNSYMITTFFKTVFLVIVIGAIHGLVFLPVLLSVFVRGLCVIRVKKKDSVQPAELPTAAAGEDAENVFGPSGRYGIHLRKVTMAPGMGTLRIPGTRKAAVS